MQPLKSIFKPVQVLVFLLVLTLIFISNPASPVFGSSTVFFEDFENGYDAWTMDGLWNAEAQADLCGQQVAPFPSPSHAAYYGNDQQCDYNTGVANSGFLTLDTVIVMPPLASGRTATLTFNSFEEAESSIGYDVRRVEVSVDGGTTWIPLGQGSVQNTWAQRSYDLTSYLGSNLSLRFHFNTVDASLNGYYGWMVDNISIFTIDPPNAVDDTGSTDEDSLLVRTVPGVLANDSDPDYDPLTVIAFQETSALGALVRVNPDGSFTYDPTGAASLQALDVGDARQDAFTYTVSDGNGGQATANVKVLVNGVDDAPVANADTASTDEDVPMLIRVLSNDTDIERDRLVIAAFNQGGHGSVQFSPDGASLAYSPALNYFGTDTFSYTVSDGSLTSVGTVTVTVSSLNDPPALAVIGDQTVDESSQLAFNAQASDPDLPANTLAYSLDPGFPAGASIDAHTGAFTWIPSEAQGPGLYSVTVRVTDNGSPNLYDSETIKVSVNEVNAAPVLTSPGNKTVNEGVLLSFAVTAADADLPGNQLTYSLDPGAPAGAGIDPASGQFTWTPTEAQGPGTYSMTVRVTDDGSPNRSDTKTFNVTVNEGNNAPVLDPIGNKTIDEGVPFTFTAKASDTDLPANNLTFSLSSAPSGASINATAGVFTWMPAENQGPQNFKFTVRVRDNGSPAMEDFEEITVTVLEVNRPPVLNTIGNKSVNDNSTLTFTASASDPDLPANTRTYSLDPGAPVGASINPSGGQFTWTPPEDTGPGTYTITVRVKDSGSPSMEDSETITVTVTEGNADPILNFIGSKTINEGNLLTFTATAADIDIPMNSLAYSLDAGAPAGAGIDPVTGQFSWTPSEAQGPASYNLTIRVNDNGSPARNDNETIRITVGEINQAPVLAAIGNKTVNEGTLFSFTATVTDADLPVNTITYSLDPGAPAGASIHSTSGLFTWTPTEAHGPGSYPVTVRVRDSGSPTLEDWETFNISVLEVNAVPVLAAIGDKSVPEGSALTFTAVANDSDNQPNSLTFSLDPGAPLGASISPSNGQFTWTPTETQGPGSYPVTIRVTDDGSPQASDSETITITVTEVNSSPLLAPVTDQEIDEDTLLTFPVLANDPDEPANPLVFSLDPGAPTGASLDPGSGVFRWTPSEAQGPGVYQITLNVNDGGSPELGSSQTFQISVNEVNSQPSANDDQYFLPYNSSSTFLDVLINDSFAPDIGETLTILEANPASHGTVLLAGGKVNYTPDTGYSGSDAFRYQITDGHGGSDTAQVNLTIGQPPQPPDVEAGPDQSAAEGQPVSFTGSYTNYGPPYKGEGLPLITWNFGDGSILTGSLSPNHTYLENGLYTVSLSVLAENGGQSSDTLVVTVTNVPPAVNAGVDQSVKAGNSVHFSGWFVDPSPLDTHTVTWDFGDGQTAVGSLSTNHVYSEPGVYSASLWVSDDDGGRGTDTLVVTVKPPSYKLYLPVINRPGKVDLLGSFKLVPQKTAFVQGEPVEIQVTVTNAGEAAVGDFWVDFYINPSNPPTSAGPAWDKLCRLSPCYGIAWYVSEPLLPGSSLTLTSQPGSYAANYTRWTGSFVGGTTDLYLLVDSWFPFGSSGAIPETDENNNNSELHGLYVSGSGKPPEDGQPPVNPR